MVIMVFTVLTILAVLSMTSCTDVVSELQTITQEVPMPRCNYSVKYQYQLKDEYKLKFPYLGPRGMVHVNCFATKSGDTITRETLGTFSSVCYRHDYKLAFTYECNYNGLFEYIHDYRRIDLLNLVYIRLLDCYIYVTERNETMVAKNNIVYHERRNCVINFSETEYGEMLFYINKNVSCIFGYKAVHYIEHNTTQVIHPDPSPDVGRFTTKLQVTETVNQTHNLNSNNVSTLLAILDRQQEITKMQFRWLSGDVLSGVRNKLKCPNLQFLEVTNQPRPTPAIDTLLNEVQLFYTPNLEVLNASVSGLAHIPSSILSMILNKTSQVLKIIDLSWNNISSFQFSSELSKDARDVVNMSRPLFTNVLASKRISVDFKRLLRLRHCNIKTIQLHNVEEFRKYSFLEVDISENPIDCDCNLEPGLDYMYEQAVYLQRHRDVVTALVHNFIYLKCCPSRHINYHERTGVLLIYNHCNSETADAIMEKLQTDVPGIRIRSDQDMEPNGLWLTQMDMMVKESVYTVMLLSRDFMQDGEIMMAFRMAYQQSILERRQSLIAVLLDSRDELGDVTDQTLEMFLRFNQCLVHGERWFWHKLLHRLTREPRETYTIANANEENQQELQV